MSLVVADTGPVNYLLLPTAFMRLRDTSFRCDDRLLRDALERAAARERSGP